MKDDVKIFLFEKEKKVNSFKNYLEKLLNNSNNQNNHCLPYKIIRRDNVELEVKEPSLEEIEQIVNTLKKS